METIIRADYGTTRQGKALLTKEDWFKEIEVSGWHNNIRIESTKKEYLEALLNKLPKYVSAKIRECGTQIAVETDTSISYYKPVWFSLNTSFTNNSKLTGGANETAIKRANKMFALIDNYSIETGIKDNSISEYFKNNLDVITDIHIYEKVDTI